MGTPAASVPKPRRTTIQDDDVLGQYLKELNTIPLLTREEEHRTALKAAQGDQKAKEGLVKANLRFVVRVAKQYQHRGLQRVFRGFLGRILANNLKEERRRLGISQEKLAERCGLSTSFITDLENVRKFPSPETLEKLAEALEVKPYHLLMEESESEILRRYREVVHLLEELKEIVYVDVGKTIRHFLTTGKR